jgi:hypothetical protein
MLPMSIALALTSCALFLTKESRYFRTVKNHATQSDVRQQLGRPADTMLDEKGQTIWVYQSRKRVQQGTNNAWTTLEAWQCDSYSLTFDEHQILRDWTHTSREC